MMAWVATPRLWAVPLLLAVLASLAAAQDRFSNPCDDAAISTLAATGAYTFIQGVAAGTVNVSKAAELDLLDNTTSAGEKCSSDPSCQGFVVYVNPAGTRSFYYLFKGISPTDGRNFPKLATSANPGACEGTWILNTALPPPPAACSRPTTYSWCERTGQEVFNVDCDGDGLLDWACANVGELGWGGLLSSQNCVDTFPFGGIDSCPSVFYKDCTAKPKNSDGSEWCSGAEAQLVSGVDCDGDTKMDMACIYGDGHFDTVLSTDGCWLTRDAPYESCAAYFPPQPPSPPTQPPPPSPVPGADPAPPSPPPPVYGVEDPCSKFGINALRTGAYESEVKASFGDMVATAGPTAVIVESTDQPYPYVAIINQLTEVSRLYFNPNYDGRPNALDTYGGYLAVALDGVKPQEDGKMYIYSLNTSELVSVMSLSGCATPNDVKWTPNGGQIVIACRGLPSSERDGADPTLGVNPQGAIVIVSVTWPQPSTGGRKLLQRNGPKRDSPDPAPSPPSVPAPPPPSPDAPLPGLYGGSGGNIGRYGGYYGGYIHPTGNGPKGTGYKLLEIQPFLNATEDLIYRGWLASGFRIDPRVRSKLGAGRDVEPTYVAINDDGSKAYVTLQKNNAITPVDLTPGKEAILDVWPLGWQDWSTVQADLSDTNGPLLSSYPKGVYSYYQPAGIKYFKNGARGYLFIANQGLVRKEATRVKDLKMGLDPAVFPDNTTLLDDAVLGRFLVDPLHGITGGYNYRSDWDQQGPYEKLLGFGGRSWSIVDTQTGALIYDSGGDIERLLYLHPAAGVCFNCPRDSNKADLRSAISGPEPSTIDLVTMYSPDWDTNRTYVAVGLDAMSGFLLYNAAIPAAPIGYFTARDFSAPANTAASALGDLAPVAIHFVPAEANPAGKPVLLVSNEVSASVAEWEIEVCGGVAH